MLAESERALCSAGRADGMRVTEARSFTDRRSAGRGTGLGATAFFLAADLLAVDLRMAGFFALAALRLAGFFPLPDPVFDLPLAMLASRCPFPVCPVDAAHFHTKDGVFSSLSGGGPTARQDPGEGGPAQVFLSARTGQDRYHRPMSAVLLTPGEVPLATWRDVYRGAEVILEPAAYAAIDASARAVSAILA